MSHEWIAPHEHERRIKAVYVVGAISFEQFERAMDAELRKPQDLLPGNIPYGSELRYRLLVEVS